VNLKELDELLNVAHVEPSAWLEVCDLIAEAFGGIGAAIIPVDKTARLPWLVHSSSLDKVTRAYIKDEWYLNDIRENGLAEARKKGFTTDLDFITENEMSNTPYYRDFLRPLGIGGFLAILFKVERREWVLSVQLPIGMLEPKEEHICSIPEIRQKLETAAQTSVKNLQARWEQIITDSTLLNQGVILFDVDNSISLISNLASQMLERNSIDTKTSSFPDRVMKEKVQDVLKSFNGGPVINQIHAISRRKELDLFCKISTVPEDLRIFNSSAVSMMVLVEAKSFSSRLDELLVDIYGLTKTEKLITIQLVEAKKLKDVAVFLNITEGNARQHLKKIFRKIDIGSQTELIVKIMRECTMIYN
jgi:DNA-binding CsgD family transcriptional regulator